MTDSVSDVLRSRLDRHRLIIASTGKAFRCYLPLMVDLCDHRRTVREFVDSELPELGSVLIEDLESACATRELGGSDLGRLRSKVDEFLLRGGTVLLASRYPRVRFPDIPGSSLLDDARAVHLPLTSGSASGPLACFPSWSEDQDSVTWLRELLEELGLELVSRLDQVLFESPMEPNEALNQLPSNELESLYYSGLIRPEATSYVWVNMQLLVLSLIHI